MPKANDSAGTNNPSLFVELADLLVLAGDLAEAESILNGLAKDAPGRSKADQRLLVAKKAESLPEPSALQTKAKMPKPRKIEWLRDLILPTH